MCGRFVLSSPWEVLRETFPGLVEMDPFSFQPRYNIAPSQKVLAIPNPVERPPNYYHWGLIPFWAKDKKIGHHMINARVETLDQKPSFRQPFARRRCLIPTNAYYEWSKDKEQKIPMLIRLQSAKPFAFAGLWEVWKPAGEEPVLSCTIITTESNRLIRPIHDRMPLIIPPEHYRSWLGENRMTPEEMNAILSVDLSNDLEIYPVSTWVNNPRNDSAECIQPVS